MPLTYILIRKKKNVYNNIYIDTITFLLHSIDEYLEYNFYER